MENRKTRKTRKNKLLLFCAHFQREHWVVYFIFVKLSAVWYPLLLTYGGSALHFVLYTENKTSLTLTGWVCTVVLLMIIGLGEGSLKYEGLAYDITYFERMYNILAYLRERKNNICKSKCRTLLEEIKKIRAGKNTVPQRIISNPLKQLELIVNEIVNCLCEFLNEEGGIKWYTDDIYVSIAYERPADRYEWHWATEEKGLSIEELRKVIVDGNTKKKSTFQHLIDSNTNNVFYNSKADAEKLGVYISDDLDERDATNRLLGSIACYKRTLKQDDSKYITYILSISTYNRKFVETEDSDLIDNVKFNIKELVILDFMKRIDIELSLLYLDDLWKERQKHGVTKLIQ